MEVAFKPGAPRSRSRAHRERGRAASSSPTRRAHAIHHGAKLRRTSCQVSPPPGYQHRRCPAGCRARRWGCTARPTPVRGCVPRHTHRRVHQVKLGAPESCSPDAHEQATLSSALVQTASTERGSAALSAVDDVAQRSDARPETGRLQAAAACAESSVLSQTANVHVPRAAGRRRRQAAALDLSCLQFCSELPLSHVCAFSATPMLVPCRTVSDKPRRRCGRGVTREYGAHRVACCACRTLQQGLGAPSLSPCWRSASLANAVSIWP